MKKVEIFLKKIFLKFFFGIGKFNKKKITSEFGPESKILLIRLNKIGDALVTTPFIKILKENTGSRIFVLADRKNHFVFEKNSNIEKLIIFKKNFLEIFKLIKSLNKEDFDAVVDLHDDVSTTVTFLISLLNSKNKFALGKSNDPVYTKTVKKLETSTSHVIDRNLELLKLFKIEPAQFNKFNVEYNFGSEAKSKADEFVSSLKLNDEVLIGINISAGNEARFWGIQNFKKFISEISEHNFKPVLLCSPSDLQTAQFISKGIYPVFESNNFDEIAAIISKLDILFTPDTAVIHLASSYEIPVFGLYVKFNTNDMIWYPYRSKYEAVITEESTLQNMNYLIVFNRFMEFVKKYEFNRKNS